MIKLWPFNRKKLLALIDLFEKRFDGSNKEKIVAAKKFLENFEAACSRIQRKKFFQEIGDLKMSEGNMNIGVRDNNQKKMDDEFIKFDIIVKKIAKKI
jgi:hypothetical protein